MNDKQLVKELGDKIGYGNLMRLCEEIWREKDGKGGEFTVGPCGAFMVKCSHPNIDENGHCDICCGSGRITTGVEKIINILNS